FRDEAAVYTVELYKRKKILLPEAELLAGMAINSPKDVEIAAARLIGLGAGAVLIKGGHFSEENELVTDWLALPGQTPEPLQIRRINTVNNHGTGCTLAAAVTAHLGLGLDLREAIVQSQLYLNTCLRLSYNPGKGCGPVNHAAPLFRQIAGS
ncbi:MAG: bifunctional hydroxymethylpyrimidine kinase/phosphomethylpyrimidine kinase, partial [Desulfovibrionaceae bacterium]|nr:bifunctional hydroxymethylpyrimidine kinase/phosphomethylpyrimidine kinase [Desulfovibrionaceae bacterium]